MKLNTPVEIKPLEKRLTYKDSILFVGSCFADEIGRRCTERYFDTRVNPFGVLFNYYASHIDVYTKPYPGIPELIKALSTSGYSLAVASNKIQAGADKLISEFFTGTDFVAVMGNSPQYPLKPDAALVEYIMEKAGTDRAHTIMVGDSGTDIQTARNAGIPIIAVSWGFRPRHELTGADHIADSTTQLKNTIGSDPFVFKKHTKGSDPNV